MVSQFSASSFFSVSSALKPFPFPSKCALRFAGISSLASFAFRLAFPAVHLVLRQSHLREHAIDVLPNKIVNRFRLMIERHDCWHDHRARLLRAQHIFEMNPAERSVAHAKHQ